MLESVVSLAIGDESNSMPAEDVTYLAAGSTTTMPSTVIVSFSHIYCKGFISAIVSDFGV